MKGILLGALLVTLLAGCATAPTQSTLVSAQTTQSLAPLLPMRRFVANIERTGGFVLSPDGQRLLWSQTVGTDNGLAVRPVADAGRHAPHTQAIACSARTTAGRAAMRSTHACTAG